MLELQSYGIDALVEQHIRKAIARGEFDHLPGAGKPLPLDDDAMVPAELRAAYRLLKNSGYVPPELEQVQEVNQLLAAATRGEIAADSPRARRLRALLVQLELAGRSATVSAAWQQYDEALRRHAQEPGST